MITKVYLFLIAALLASCASHNPQAMPTGPANNGAASACDKTSLENRIKTLEAEKEALQVINSQLNTRLAEANARPSDQERVSAVLAICQAPKKELLKLFCALGTSYVLQMCGIKENSDGSFTFTEPSKECPISKI